MTRAEEILHILNSCRCGLKIGSESLEIRRKNLLKKARITFKKLAACGHVTK